MGDLDKLRAIVGAAHVDESMEALAAANRGTFVGGGEVRAIVRPGTVEEVQACLRECNQARWPVYATSRGRNWGYGSRVPPSGECIALSLERLDRIVGYDEALAAVRVQAGVTFEQLATFLDARGGRLVASAIGGPPDSSLVGNLMERGIGKGPLADRFANASDLEVILADGRVLRTGWSRFDGAASAGLHRWGVGPYIDGLFTQSSFGVVTAATIWLTPKPAYASTFLAHVDEDAQLPALVDAFRVLRMEGTITSSVLVANDVRRMSFARQYPWDEAGGRTPIPPDVRRKLRTAGAWGGDATLYAATEQRLAADRARVTDVLGRIGARLVFIGDGDRDDPRQRALENVHRLALGRTLERTAATAYWRKKGPLPEVLDPDRDRCGLIWFSPVVPLSGEHAVRISVVIEEVLVAHGFDPNIAFNCVSDRAMDTTSIIAYDRDVPGEDERAARCHRELFRRCAALGYYPYRLTIQSMNELPPSATWNEVAGALKDALDPNGILAPGRYDFRGAR